MTNKIIGWRLTNRKGDVPKGLSREQVFQTLDQAYKYGRESLGLEWFIQAVREGEIKTPQLIPLT